MDGINNNALEAAEFIKTKIINKPDIAIVLGSGLGSLANKLTNVINIEYKDIPGFPVSTVKGHAGMLVCGTLGNKTVLAMKGRFHYYEGYDISQVVLYVRVFKHLGINKLILTNAAGGINREFRPGDLMIIKDHISFFCTITPERKKYR